MEQEQYEEDVKVVILPDRQEVTSDDLATMPDVVRERVRSYLFSGNRNCIIHSHCHIKTVRYLYDVTLHTVYGRDGS